MERYTYEEVLFVVEAANETYKRIYDMELRSQFPTDYKRSIYKKFCEKFGNKHPYNSVKMMIDNILANWNVDGYKKFSKGSSLVKETAIKVRSN